MPAPVDWYKVANNAKSTLLLDIADGAAVTMTLLNGADFPAVFPYFVTIWDSNVASQPGDDPGMEIVKVTNRVGDVFTIVRGQEGTAGVAHDALEKVQLLLVAGNLQQIHDEIDLRVLAAGDKIGDGTNYTQFAADGEMTLHGTARVLRHIYIRSDTFKKVTGGSPPEDTLEGYFATVDFDDSSLEQVYYTLNVPSRWAVGTDIAITVIWMHDANAPDAAKFVRWGLDYRAVAVGEAVAGAVTTITQDQAALDANQGLRIDTAFATGILGANLATHDQVGIRFYRDAPNDDYVGDARLIGVHFVFTLDKLGEATV